MSTLRCTDARVFVGGVEIGAVSEHRITPPCRSEEQRQTLQCAPLVVNFHPSPEFLRYIAPYLGFRWGGRKSVRCQDKRVAQAERIAHRAGVSVLSVLEEIEKRGPVGASRYFRGRRG